jgi:hypothetical protein
MPVVATSHEERTMSKLTAEQRKQLEELAARPDRQEDMKGSRKRR